MTLIGSHATISCSARGFGSDYISILTSDMQQTLSNFSRKQQVTLPGAVTVEENEHVYLVYLAD